MEFFKKIGWTKVASLTQEGDQYSGYVSELQDYLQTHGIDFVINRKFQESAINTPEADMSMVSLVFMFEIFAVLMIITRYSNLSTTCFQMSF